MPPSDNRFALYNAGSGEVRPLRDYLEAIAAALTDSGRPVALNYGAVPYRSDEPMSSIPDLARLHARFAWRPQIGFTPGIASFVRWSLTR